MIYKTVSPMDDILKTAQIIWKSERLVYREVDPQDEELQLWVHKNISNDPMVSVLTSDTLVRPHNKKWTREGLDGLVKSAIHVTITLPAPEDDPEQKDQIIGVCGYYGVSGDRQQQRTGTFGIFIAQQYQNNGYGTEATRWTVDFAFRFGNLHCLCLETLSFNTRAIKVYEKVGFVVEGRRRERMYFDRKWYDVVDMAILEQEWEARREKGEPSTAWENVLVDHPRRG